MSRTEYVTLAHDLRKAKNELARVCLKLHVSILEMRATLARAEARRGEG